MRCILSCVQQIWNISCHMKNPHAELIDKICATLYGNKLDFLDARYIFMRVIVPATRILILIGFRVVAPVLHSRMQEKWIISAPRAILEQRMHSCGPYDNCRHRKNGKCERHSGRWILTNGLSIMHRFGIFMDFLSEFLMFFSVYLKI